MNELPPSNGTESFYTLQGDGTIGKTRLTFGTSVQAIGDFSDRLHYFTPAALYVYAGFTDRILIDFLTSYRKAVSFYVAKFSKPVVTGLEDPKNGDPTANHYLWAVEHVHWQPLLDHLCSAILTHTQGKEVFRIGHQELQILDPLANDKNTLLYEPFPIVTMSAFGVLGTRYTAGFLPGRHLMECPRFVFREPDKAAAKMGQILFQDERPGETLNVLHPGAK